MKAAACPFTGWGLLLLLGVSAAERLVPWPWSVRVLPILAALGLGAGCICRNIPGRIWMAGGALLALIALYALNPTHRWADGLGLQPVAHFRGWPGSASSAETWNTLGLAAAMVAAFALAFQLTPRQVRGLQFAACAGAVAMALLVLAQRLEPKPYPIFEFTGIFVNENHFAAFANMILPVVLALAVRTRFRAVLAGRPASPAGLYLLGAMVMAVAVAMCRSRAGMAVLALLVAALASVYHRLIRQHPFLETPALSGVRWLIWLAVAAASVGAMAAFARGWCRLDDFLLEWQFRFGILRDAWKAWRESPYWGVGPGTFPVVYPFYQSPGFMGRTILHAHCEAVQFLTEFGVLGGLWVLGAAGLALTARRQDRFAEPEIPAFAELERRAFAFGLAACGLHCLVDFPLRIPLIALLAATWAGVWAGTRPNRKELAPAA